MKTSIKQLTILASLMLFLSSCKNDKKTESNANETEISIEEVVEVEVSETHNLTINLDQKNGSGVSGSVSFTVKDGTVAMTATLSGLTEGEHAIHIHEKADCSSADGKSTGGHWNPTAQPHGKWGDVTGYHKGDIGNFTANAEGKAEVTFSTNEWCIGCGDETKDIVGKAIIVHQGIDDFTSQPSGAAGSRISCGGIIK